MIYWAPKENEDVLNSFRRFLKKLTSCSQYVRTVIWNNFMACVVVQNLNGHEVDEKSKPLEAATAG